METEGLDTRTELRRTNRTFYFTACAEYDNLVCPVTDPCGISINL